jgi:hypothetical protein
MKKFIIITCLACFGVAFGISEFMIDTNRFYGACPGAQQYPAIAFDGVNYFTVWSQSLWLPGYVSSTIDGIYGTRINQNGTVIDSICIPIAVGACRLPDIAYDGTNYLVVWDEESVIYGARVSPEGILLDTNPVRISHGEGWAPIIAFNGTNYLVVWNGTAGSLYGVRVSPSFEILDPSDILICTTPYETRPGISSDGNNYFVVWAGTWNGFNNVIGIIVSSQGVPSAPIIVSDNNDGRNPSLDFDGDNYLVAWEKSVDLSHWGVDIYGRRVSADGTIIDAVDMPISHIPYTCEWRPEVCFNGTRYLIGYHVDIVQQGGFVCYDIYGSFVTPDFTVTDPFDICTVLENQSNSAIASNDSDYCIIWADERYGTYDQDIYGSRVDTDGNVLDPDGILISTTTNRQAFPSVAFNGSDYLTVWQDTRNGADNGIYGARVTPWGYVIDRPAIPISEAENQQLNPAIATNGSDFLIVWEDQRNGIAYASDKDIYGARVTSTGIVLDTAGILIADAWSGSMPYIEYDPAVIYGAGQYLVVWNRGAIAYAARITTDGIVLDTSGIQIGVGWVSGEHSVAFDGTNYFVVWYNSGTVRGTFVDQNGSVISNTTITTSGGIEPCVAFDGNNYLVAWQVSNDIKGALVSPSGTVLASFTICDAQDEQIYPSVAFDGTDYLVIWQDYRNMIKWDIYGARVTTDGVVLDTLGVQLIDQTNDRYYASISGGPNNQLLIVYWGIDSEYNNVGRVYGAFYPEVSVEEKNIDIAMPIRFIEIYPNPFSDVIHLKFQSAKKCGGPRTKNQVELEIYDATGRLVKNFNLKSPSSSVIWDGCDNKGERLSSGIYFCCLQSGTKTEKAKLILLKQ